MFVEFRRRASIVSVGLFVSAQGVQPSKGSFAGLATERLVTRVCYRLRGRLAMNEGRKHLRVLSCRCRGQQHTNGGMEHKRLLSTYNQMLIFGAKLMAVSAMLSSAIRRSRVSSHGVDLAILQVKICRGNWASHKADLDGSLSKTAPTEGDPL